MLEDTLEIVTQVAEALDYSHARGVIHRDIKPENVMVAGESASPRAKVMDFGLALAGAASRLTRTGKLPGTLAYLSPNRSSRLTSTGAPTSIHWVPSSTSA